MNSVEIAKKYNKQHKHVLDAIRNVLKRNPELSSHFKKTFYINLQNKKQPMYSFDLVGENVIENKFKYNVRNARFEYKMLNELCDFLDELHIKYIKQYPILTYKIDLFLPDYNLSVEYDEEQHKFKQKYDKNRENNIKDILGCEFVRIKENETVGTAIGRILKEIGGDICNERKVV